MIQIHRLGHPDEPFYLNPDLIQTVESNPDTVITLTTQTRVVVSESADAVVDAIRDWRVEILTDALKRRR